MRERISSRRRLLLILALTVSVCALGQAQRNVSTNNANDGVQAGGRCTLAGSWKQTAENVGTSIWEIDSTGKAIELDLGRATGTATLTGNKLRIDWKTSDLSGYYEWLLDSDCNSGQGELVFQKGYSGTHKSTVTRQSGVKGDVNSAPPALPALPAPSPAPIPPVDSGSSKGMAKFVNEPDHSPDKLDFGEVWNGQSSNRIFRLTANASGYVRVDIPTGPFRVAEIQELGPERMMGGKGTPAQLKGPVRDPKGHVNFPAGKPGPWTWSANTGNEVKIYVVFEPKFDLFQMTAGEKSATMKVSGPGPKGDWALIVPLRGMFNGLIVGAVFTVEDRDVMAVQGTQRIDVAVRLTGTDSVLYGTIRGKNLPPGIQIDPVPATVNPAQTTITKVPVVPDWGTLQPDGQPRNIELVFDAGEKSSSATFSLTPLPKKSDNSGNPSPKISTSDYDDSQTKKYKMGYEVLPGTITRLRITLSTGDDDLRYNSTVSAFLITQDDTRIKSDALNCNKGECNDPGLASNSRRTFEWNIPPEAYLYPANIRRFGLSFESKSSSIFQTGDNWDLDKLEVEYMVTVGTQTSPKGTFLMYKGSGKPLYRFKTKEEWETEPLNLKQ